MSAVTFEKINASDVTLQKLQDVSRVYRSAMLSIPGTVASHWIRHMCTTRQWCCVKVCVVAVAVIALLQSYGLSMIFTILMLLLFLLPVLPYAYILYFNYVSDPVCHAPLYSDPNHVLLVAVQDGAIVGMLFMMHVSEERAYVKDLFVAPEAQGRGIATRLMRHLMCSCIAKSGYSVIEFQTSSLQYPQLRLQQGFIHNPAVQQEWRELTGGNNDVQLLVIHNMKRKKRHVTLCGVKVHLPPFPVYPVHFRYNIMRSKCNSGVS